MINEKNQMLDLINKNYILSEIGIELWNPIFNYHPKLKDSKEIPMLFDKYLINPKLLIILPFFGEKICFSKDLEEITYKMISVLGFAKKDIVLVRVYLSDIVKNFNENKFFEKIGKNEDEILSYEDFDKITNKLKLLNPKNVLHFGQRIVSNFKYEFLTYHPLYLLKNKADKKLAYKDLLMIKEQIKNL